MTERNIRKIITLCILSMIISLVSLCIVIVKTIQSSKSSGKEDIQYVVYLGTNDKDTNKPVFNENEARQRLEDILIEHFDGYTIQEANGGWVNNGISYREYTLVIYLSDTTRDKVHNACNDMIRQFNQSSVLIQCNSTVTEFYSAED